MNFRKKACNYWYTSNIPSGRACNSLDCCINCSKKCRLRRSRISGIVSFGSWNNTPRRILGSPQEATRCKKGSFSRRNSERTQGLCRSLGASRKRMRFSWRWRISRCKCRCFVLRRSRTRLGKPHLIKLNHRFERRSFAGISLNKLCSWIS